MWIFIIFGILLIIALASDKNESPAKNAAQGTLMLVFGVPLMIIGFLLAAAWVAKNINIILSIISTVLAVIILVAAAQFIIEKSEKKKDNLDALKNDIIDPLSGNAHAFFANQSTNSDQVSSSLETIQNRIESSTRDTKKARTLYEIIGVSDTASRQEISRACSLRLTIGENLLKKNDFRAESVISAIKDAELTLLDPKKRREYDEKINKIQNKYRIYRYISYSILIMFIFISSFFIYKAVREDNAVYVVDEIAYINKGKDLFTGTHRSYFDNGNLKQEANYKDGRLNGVFTEWYQNGVKKKEEHYYKGILNGLKNEWNNNSQKLSEQTYVGGRLNGVKTLWDENGKKKSIAMYSDDKKNGLEISWNGEKKQEVTYANDVLVGLSVIWANDVKKEEVITYKNGKKNGIFMAWHQNGLIAEESIYENDKLEGIKTIYNDKGKKISEAIYSYDILIDTLIDPTD